MTHGHDADYDETRQQAVEEMTFATSHALETLIRLMIDKGYFSEEEFIKKMDDLVDPEEDPEELGLDADNPREKDDD